LMNFLKLTETEFDPDQIISTALSFKLKPERLRQIDGEYSKFRERQLRERKAAERERLLQSQLRKQQEEAAAAAAAEAAETVDSSEGLSPSPSPRSRSASVTSPAAVSSDTEPRSDTEKHKKQKRATTSDGGKRRHHHHHRSREETNGTEHPERRSKHSKHARRTATLEGVSRTSTAITSDPSCAATSHSLSLSTSNSSPSLVSDSISVFTVTPTATPSTSIAEPVDTAPTLSHVPSIDRASYRPTPSTQDLLAQPARKRNIRSKTAEFKDGIDLQQHR
jgi:hypothetical protein